MATNSATYSAQCLLCLRLLALGSLIRFLFLLPISIRIFRYRISSNKRWVSSKCRPPINAATLGVLSFPLISAPLL